MQPLLLSLLVLFFIISCDTNPTTEEKKSDNTTTEDLPPPSTQVRLTYPIPQLYPEGIEYHLPTKSILLGSMNGQAIKRIDEEGNITNFTQEASAPLGSIGLEIDEERGRLIVCYSDRKKQLQEAQAVVRIFDLETGELLQDFNLAALIEAEDYQANDATVTTDGTIIISDRKGNALYKIDPNYQASVFYRNEAELQYPNGLAYHPDDFVLVAHQTKNKTSKLYKFPYLAPEEKQAVAVEDTRFQGFDGLVLVDENTLVGVSTVPNDRTQDALIELTTADNWATAKISNYKKIPPSTTVAMLDKDQYYVLLQDFKNPDAEKIAIEDVRF